MNSNHDLSIPSKGAINDFNGIILDPEKIDVNMDDEDQAVI